VAPRTVLLAVPVLPAAAALAAAAPAPVAPATAPAAAQRPDQPEQARGPNDESQHGSTLLGGSALLAADEEDGDAL
jgi:hypothetical protein